VKEYPEDAGTEQAVSSLSHLLFGYTSTPFSTLAILVVNGKSIPVLISRTVIGEKCKVGGLDATNGRNKDLATIQSDGGANEKLEPISEESFGISVARTLLTDPADDRHENLLIETTRNPYGDRNRRLFCVDNDHGFLVKNISHGVIMKDTCFLKTVVYCMNGMQTVNISAFVRKAIVSIDVYSLLIAWLQHLQNRHEDHMTLFASELREFSDESPDSYSYMIWNKQNKAEVAKVQIGLSFVDCLGVDLFYKLMRLQDILRPDGINKNWFEVLAKMDWQVAELYATQLKQTNKQWYQRFNDIASDQYEVVKLSQGTEYRQTDSQYRISQQKSAHQCNKKFGSVDILMINLKAECVVFVKTLPQAQLKFISTLHVDPSYEGDSTMAIEMRQAILNGKESHGKVTFGCIFAEINKLYIVESKVRAKQRQILERLKGTGAIFKDLNKYTRGFKRMNFSYCIELTDDDLSYHLSFEIEWLDIRNCFDLTILSLGHIMEKCEKLEVLYFSFDLLLKANALDLSIIFGERRVLSKFRKVYINRYRKTPDIIMRFSSQVQVLKQLYGKLREFLPNLEEIYVRDDDLKIDIRIDVASLYQQPIYLFDRALHLSCYVDHFPDLSLIGTKLLSCFDKDSLLFSFPAYFMASLELYVEYTEPIDLLKLRLLFLPDVDVVNQFVFIFRSAIANAEFDVSFFNLLSRSSEAGLPGYSFDTLFNFYFGAAYENHLKFIDFIESHFDLSDDFRSLCLRWLISFDYLVEEVESVAIVSEKILKKCSDYDAVLKSNFEHAIRMRCRAFVHFVIQTKPELRDAPMSSVGITPLMLAVETRDMELLRILFDSGRPDIERKNMHGISSLDYAIISHFAEIQAFLLEHDASIESECYGKPLLHLAAYVGEVSFIRMVYEKENDLSLFTTLDSDGDDVLTVAVRKSQKEVVDYLLAVGVESEQAQLLEVTDDVFADEIVSNFSSATASVSSVSSDPDHDSLFGMSIWNGEVPDLGSLKRAVKIIHASLETKTGLERESELIMERPGLIKTEVGLRELISRFLALRGKSTRYRR
jgi:ankyrin repeat protein